MFPTPVQLWSNSHRQLLLAMYFVFSVGWALEQCVVFVTDPFAVADIYCGRVTHFEGNSMSTINIDCLSDERAIELAFWLFLLDQKQEQRVWFESWEYRLWYTSASRTFLINVVHLFLMKKHSLRRCYSWYAPNYTSCA
jgi:hypothetical protein